MLLTIICGAVGTVMVLGLLAVGFVSLLALAKGFSR
jgi:hypothetical protein